MKFSINIILCLIVFNSLLSIESFAQNDIDINNLAYCRTDMNLANLWFINQKMALATRLYKNNEFEVKDIILIDNQGLVVDSISIPKLYSRSKDYNHQKPSNVYRVNKNEFYFCFGSCSYLIKIENNKILHNKTTSPCAYNYTLSPSIAQENPFLKIQSIGIIPGHLIGYYRSKSRNKGNSAGVSVDDEKNFPSFWVAKINNQNEIDKLITINTPETKLTEDLYVDIKDWDLVYARPNTFSSHYSIDNHKIFFNVCRANKLYIYDIATEQITQYEYPEKLRERAIFICTIMWVSNRILLKNQEKNT